MSLISSVSGARIGLVAGQGEYVSDVFGRDDALWMHVVRSDIAHGKLTGIDATAAEDRPGVFAVLAAADFDEVPRIPIRVGRTPLLESRLQPVLAVGRVRYVGEPVAIVLAETPAAAEEAAALVWADIDPLPAITTVDSDARMWDDLDHNILIEETFRDGDVAAVLAASAQVVDLKMSTARRTGLPIEPRALMAAWESGVLHTWGPTKFVHFTAITLADFLGLEPRDVICHRVEVGGMFGVRGEFYPEDFLVPWAARFTGRPVRWQEHRRDHLAAINHAGEQYHHIEVGISEDGRLTGLLSEVTQDLGAYPRPIGSRLAGILLEMMPGPYKWDAYEVRFRALSTSKAPTGTVRGPAALETTFVRERAVDVAARRAGHDPRSVRRQSLISTESIPYRRKTGQLEKEIVFDSGDYLQVFDETLKLSGYQGWIEERDRRRLEGEYVGIGLGTFVLHTGLGGVETVSVDLESDGRFLVRTSASEVGQGLDLMAGRALGAMLEVSEADVAVWSGATEAHEGGVGTFSSRSTLFVANALADAAKNLRSHVAEKAAGFLRCRSDQIVFNPKGPAYGLEQLRWKDVAPVAVTGRFEMGEATYGFGLHLALVSVDIETGDVVSEKMAVAYDCGRALDTANVVDQIVGAAAMGVGAALYEQFIYDAGGNPVSSNLSDYLIPTATSLPAMEVFVFETAPAGGNPLGIKGVGEAGIVGVGAAIANAVVDALGPCGDALITRLPIDRQAIALHHADEGTSR